MNLTDEIRAMLSREGCHIAGFADLHGLTKV